jgi:hypothetical protein
MHAAIVGLLSLVASKPWRDLLTYLVSLQVSGKNDQDASWAVHSEGSDDSFNSAPVAAVDIWGPPQDITADIKSRISTYLPESLSLHDDDTRDLMTPRDVSSIPPFDFSNGVTTSDSASSSFDFGINTLEPWRP